MPDNRIHQHQFQISYDGPNLAEHSMDVQHLGPALLAIGDLCCEAHRAINGDDIAKVNVRVQANFEEKCFDITFVLTQLFGETSKLLELEVISDTKELLEWIGIIGGPIVSVGYGLFRFLKWKSGRKIRSVEKNDNGDYTITVGGDKNNTTTIHNNVYKLYNTSGVITAQKGMLAPLNEDGVEVVEFKENGKTTSKITKEEYISGVFDSVEAEQLESLEPQVVEAVLGIRSPVFVKNVKWNFWFGDSRITASILDKSFIQRVFGDGERFGVGDSLKVRMSFTQTLSSQGTQKNEYTILEVLDILDIKRAPKQLDMEL